MPAAFWAGVQAPECECSTGEHRFFCPHHLLGLGSQPVGDSNLSNQSADQGPKHSCCRKAAVERTTVARTAHPAVGKSVSGPCSHCKAVPNSSPTKVVRVELPRDVQVAWYAPGLSTDQKALAELQANEHRRPPSDRLPTTDGVVDLCRLLI
jgi:hypothetical protein